MKRFRQWSLAALAFCVVSTAWAEPAAEDLIAYRKAVMGSLGSHAGAISMMIRGKVSYEHMADQAAAMASTASVIADIFPAESADGDTAALAAIWDQSDDFASKVAGAQEASAAFATAAQTGDRAAIGKAFGALGASCKGCHDNYKQAD